MRPRARIAPVRAVFLVALVCCRPPSESGRAPAPPPVGSLRHPDPVGAFGSCRAALHRAASSSPDLVYREIALGCAALFAEPTCREAVLRSATDPPDSRAATMARSCAAAYCPLLPEPRPQLCSPASSELGPSELTAAWRELVAEARRLDFGEQAGELALADPFAIATPGPIRVDSVAPRGEGPAEGPEVRLALSEEPRGLRLDASCPDETSRSWTVPAAPTASELAESLAAVPCLSTGAGAVIAAEASVPYASVVVLLDALRQLGIERVSLSIE